jgi:hypothetical protein
MLIFPACPAKVKVFLNLIKYDKLKSYTGGRLPCSMIHKIKVVSFIPSIQLERGQVGPRTSGRFGNEENLLSLPRVKPWLSRSWPCLYGDATYPSMGNEKNTQQQESVSHPVLLKN